MNELIQEILDIVRSNISNKEKKEKLSHYHDSDVADAFEFLTDEEKASLTKILGAEEASDILTYVDDKDEFLDYMKEDQAADIIENMDADDAVDALQEMEDEDREKILNLIEDDEVKEDIQLILSFEDDEVGSLMTTNYVTILDTDDVKTAMKKVIDQAKDNDNISLIFITNKEGKFVGALNLNDLIIARQGDNLMSKAITSYPALQAHAKIDDVINDIKDYNEKIIPIIDENDVVIGALTANDVVELVTSELHEDMHRLAGLTSEDKDESIFTSIKKRLPWLVLLLFLGLVVSTVISAFESVVAVVSGAVIFQSVVFDMAGNAGTQSLAVTLTNINDDDDLSKKKIWAMARKEIGIGLITGILVGILSFGVILGFLCIRHEGVYSDKSNAFVFMDCVKVASSAGVALFISLAVSNFVGLILPIIFKKIKIDPAVASGPMITTINDICSACIYYSLVGLFFSLF
jgi:magnesium transporter